MTGMSDQQPQAPGPQPPPAIDPVCGMTVHPPLAKQPQDHAGRTYYFCCESCKEEFDQHPEDYAGD
jgi:Cu+-exporting ATPase